MDEDERGDRQSTADGGDSGEAGAVESDAAEPCAENDAHVERGDGERQRELAARAGGPVEKGLHGGHERPGTELPPGGSP
jgi:hypothetical protein